MQAPCRDAPPAVVYLSVVIPALNEAAAISATLQAVRRQNTSATLEVILVDGASHDDTMAIADAAGAQVLRGERGRATQMHLGATAARGSVLLFLHADTLLPEDAVSAIESAIAMGRQWGRFDVRIQGTSPLLSVVAWCMNLRSRVTGVATGDQAMFATRSAYLAAGGFPQQPLMEDIALSCRLRRLGPPACLRERVTTSGRRWESRGVWRTVWLMWRLRLAYWLGVAPDVLAKRYR